MRGPMPVRSAPRQTAGTSSCGPHRLWEGPPAASLAAQLEAALLPHRRLSARYMTAYISRRSEVAAAIRAVKHRRPVIKAELHDRRLEARRRRAAYRAAIAAPRKWTGSSAALPSCAGGHVAPDAGRVRGTAGPARPRLQRHDHGPRRWPPPASLPSWSPRCARSTGWMGSSDRSIRRFVIRGQRPRPSVNPQSRRVGVGASALPSLPPPVGRAGVGRSGAGEVDCDRTPESRMLSLGPHPLPKPDEARGEGMRTPQRPGQGDGDERPSARRAGNAPCARSLAGRAGWAARRWCWRSWSEEARRRRAAAAAARRPRRPAARGAGRGAGLLRAEGARHPVPGLGHGALRPHRPQRRDRGAPHRRAGAAGGGARKEPTVVLTTVNAILQRVPPRDFVRRSLKTIAAGQRIDMNQLMQRLTLAGYQRTGTVMEPGEYAVRGGILDLFPPGRLQPRCASISSAIRWRTSRPSIPRRSAPADRAEARPDAGQRAGVRRRGREALPRAATWRPSAP